MKLPKLKYWYHATDIDTANKIINCGYLAPQDHKNGMSLGVFFANSLANASQWMLMRGISDYVVFKIARNRFDPNKMCLGGADRLPESLNMVCMRYLNTMRVYPVDGIIVEDKRTFDIPGCEIINEGTTRMQIKLIDREAFENYVESQPEIKKMIEKQIGHTI